MALRQGKGGIFTPACRMRLQYRREDLAGFDHRPRLFGTLCDTHRVQAEPLGGWDAADKGFFARVTSSDLQRRLSKVPTILTRCQTEFSPERCRQVGLA
jgi:hypothetical protein